MKYANPWKRLAAFLIDWFIISVTASLFYTFYFLLIGKGKPYLVNEDNSDSSIPGIIDLVLILFGWLYFILMEASSIQATLGKLVMKIKVTDTRGKQVSVAKSTIRTVVKYISSIFVLPLFIAYFSKKKQALHDMITDCLVIRK